ncbi:hypothetical protein GCM10009775_19240 [Microbacterium aoyamense]|uniref:DUF559 domain-containing protein n=1 Tax=Microbacterium aoyamense TaxID=344166 RepID=A0ABN2PQK2_9MICO
MASGGLVRVRKGRYIRADVTPTFRAAAALGVRVDCVSLLAERGIFVRSAQRQHVQADRAASRLPARASGVVCHWRDSASPAGRLDADLIEALAQAVVCQDPRAAIASLDSAWHQGWVDDAGIAEVFTRLPQRCHVLRRHLDPRSESGTETLVRLILRGLGESPELQVDIPAVGRVDFLVGGWLVIECDSEAHHSDWKAHKRDRRRDAEAARQGFSTIRLLAEDILYRPEWVVEVLRDALRAGRAAGRRS